MLTFEPLDGGVQAVPKRSKERQKWRTTDGGSRGHCGE